MIKQFIIIFGSCLLALSAAAQTNTRAPRRVEYDLFVNDTTVNYTGKHRHAIAINGQIPGPTIELTEGDTAVIRVHNLMSVTTSIHWHGILIPNEYDGVPGLTTFPIEAGKMLEVVFPVVQSGTYWYHSHTMTQEQIGLTGSIVIHKREESKMKEEVLVLNDWTDMKPNQVFRMLRRGTDWFAIRKNSVQSYGEAIPQGRVWDKVKQEWQRMPAMDISDVKYNQFHANGAETYSSPNKYKGGDTIKLRVINASASSYFWLQFAGGKVQVVAADGQDVKPVTVDKFLIATAETYDVIIQLPADGKYEVRATAQDVSGYTSAFFGEGKKVTVPEMPRVNYFNIMHHMVSMMSSMHMKMGTSKPMTNIEVNDSSMSESKSMKDHNMHQNMDMGDMKMDEMAMDKKKDTMPMTSGGKMDEMNMNDMKGGMKMMNMKMYGFDYPPGNGNDTVLSYNMLEATNNQEVPIPKGKPDRIIELTATGNMFRYVWSFNNKTLTDADKLLIKKGEHVQVIFHNNTMMEHPLHLHGHFFRLHNGKPMDEQPLKHTFNLLPMAQDTIDFAADEEKDWFFHCHTLYHMLSGMSRVFHYANTMPVVQQQNPLAYRRFLTEHGRHVFFWGNTSLQSQGNFGSATLGGTKWEINEEWSWDWKKQYESELRARRFVDKRQFFAVFAGADNRREGMDVYTNNKERMYSRNVATAGVTYFLPLLITAEGRVDSKGHFRFQLQRDDLPVTKRSRFSFAWNTDKEYTLGLKYIAGRNWAISGNYDSDYGWGAGINFIY